MGGNNELSGTMDGKRAAVELATANRPDDFTSKCLAIDTRLNNAPSEYSRSFMIAMNNEMQDRNLLPKIELNMVASNDTPAMLALQNKKHIETQDIVEAEDQLRGSGRNTEAMLMHRLGANAPDIHDTHAERNIWGKNHGGINMDRLNRWANENRADMRGAFEDIQADTRPKLTPRNNEDQGDNPPDAVSPKNHKDVLPFDPTATAHDRKQDHVINDLSDKVEKQQKAQDDLEKAAHLKEKVQAGVIKDAHHTVQHGETLYDMACLALHKAGRDHMTPNAIKFEEEKIRALNHLGPHEQLRSGQSLMLRTEQEVEHETARRIKIYEHSPAHAAPAVNPHRHWHRPQPGDIN